MQAADLHFNNGRFRIMQVADTQESPDINPNTLRLINAALDTAKPQLVVMTGDQIKGYSTAFLTGNREETARKLILDLCRPMADRGIPVTATFGNHDTQCGVSKAKQMEMYRECPAFVCGEPSGPGEEGTFVLPVDDRLLIWIFDTHEKDGHGGFGCLHPDQIEWYKSIRDSYEKKCGKALPGIAFQHIPTPEYFEVIVPSMPLAKGSIRAYGQHKNQWFALDKNNSGTEDFLKEPPAPSFINSGEIDAFLEKKDVKALFAGHNHNASFVSLYKGMGLGITQGCGFNVYGPGLDRGVRIIDIYEDGRYETHTLTYRQLCGTDIDRKLTYAKQAVAPVSIAGVVTKAKEIGTASVIIGTALLVSKKLKK